MFQLTELSAVNLDEEINPETLHDPKNKIVQAILFIYSLDTFLPQTINIVNREQDFHFVNSLGPFVILMRTILNGAQAERIDT